MGFSTWLLKCLGDGQMSKWNGLFELVTNYCYDRSERQVTIVRKRLFTSESVRSILRNRRSKFTSEIDSWTVSCCHCWIDLENTVVSLLPVQARVLWEWGYGTTLGQSANIVRAVWRISSEYPEAGSCEGWGYGTTLSTVSPVCMYLRKLTGRTWNSSEVHHMKLSTV